MSARCSAFSNFSPGVGRCPCPSRQRCRRVGRFAPPPPPPPPSNGRLDPPVNILKVMQLCAPIHKVTNGRKRMQGWRNASRGGGTRPWGPSRKRVPKCLKVPKTTYATIAIAEKQPKRRKKGPFRYILGPPGSHPGTGINGARRGRSLPVPPVSPAMSVCHCRYLSEKSVYVLHWTAPCTYHRSSALTSL